MCACVVRACVCVHVRACVCACTCLRACKSVAHLMLLTASLYMACSQPVVSGNFIPLFCSVNIKVEFHSVCVHMCPPPFSLFWSSLSAKS